MVLKRLDVALDVLVAGVLLEDGRAGEAEELGVREEFFDGLVVLAELRAVAFVEDEDHALVAKRFELFLVGRLAPLLPALLRLLFSSSARPSFWMVQTMTLSA